MKLRKRLVRGLGGLGLALGLALGPASSLAKIDLNQGQYSPIYASQEIRVANDRPYSWFMDQGATGAVAHSNCGPTSVAMVLKWLNPQSRETGESVRAYDYAQGGWWSTNIIQNYLKDRGIAYQAVQYSEAKLKEVLDQGGIALVCLNMGEISRNFWPASNNTGRFYGYDDGHFLIVKGYQLVNNRLYFQVYDPNNWGMAYADGQAQGQDRLYAADEFTQAVNSWWSIIYTFYGF